VGKTELSLRLAERFAAPIISADSRQIYKDLIIGTDAPSKEQLNRAEHYMTGFLELEDYYSAAAFENDVIALLNKLFQRHSTVILCGGSMMYIDAVCNGIDDVPSVAAEVRETLCQQYEKEGLDNLLEELKLSDPEHYERVDRKNYKRVIHALEICRTTGLPYSSFRTNTIKERPFKILKIELTREREELYARINARVDRMMAEGLETEVRMLYPFRRLNSLNTVGYKEMFAYIEGRLSLEEAVEQIKRNTRIYARKQQTWFKRDRRIIRLHPEKDESKLCELIYRML
jgi:tRNA dimethylallyltransferase